MVGKDYRRFGKGEHPVIALHGWFGSAGAWHPVWPHLDGETFHYAFLDYRGYGGRRGTLGEYTIAEAAADVVTAADELGFKKFSLIGHSMGGSVMQRVYADVPDRIRALVGISPVPASGVPFDEQGWQLFSGAADSAENRRAIINFTTGSRLSPVWLDAMVRHSLEHSDRDAFAGYLNAWARTDFHQDIADSDVPIKVIVGEHDPAINAEVMRATFQAWYPKLELEVFANAGHYAIDETPVALVSTVESFLKQH